MITNDNLSSSYGSGSIRFYDSPPQIYKPSPSASDYSTGFINRSFMVKNSNGTGYEINPSDTSHVNAAIYTVCQIQWRISGYANYTKIGNVVEDHGVALQNLQQIADTKINTGISLTPFLPNPLEFWRGY